MNEDEQVIWGLPISFLDFVLGFLAAPNQRKVEFIPKADPLKFYVREKVTPPSQNLGEIRDANKERVNRSLSNYASNNFLLSTSNIRPDLNGRYNPGLGLFAGDLTALTLSMGFDPFNTSNYYKVATLIPKFRNWGLTRLLANELNNEVRVAGELGRNVGKSTVSPIIRTKIGDVEINNPRLYYHLSGLGKAKNFFNTNRMRTPQEEYWLKLEHVPLELRTGIIPGFPQNPGRAMFSLGKLWYGLNPEQFPDLLVTAKEMPVANSKAGIVRGSLLKLESQGTRRVTSDNIDNIGPHTNQNTSAYTYIPGYGYRQIQLEPRTSLRFFERPLSKISEAERAGIPKVLRNLPIKSKTDVTENFLKFIGSDGKPQLGNKPITQALKEMFDMLKDSGVDMRKIELKDIDKALELREKLLFNSGKRFSYQEPVTSNTELIWDVDKGLKIGYIDLRKPFLKNNRGFDQELWNKYHSDPKNKGLKIGMVENTSQTKPELYDKTYYGVQEKLTNSAIDVAKLLGYEGLISGESLLSPEKTIKMYPKYKYKKVISLDGVYNWQNHNPELLKEYGPVYILLEPTYRTIIKSKIFDPRIIDSKGKMHINWKKGSSMFTSWGIPITLGGYIYENAQ